MENKIEIIVEALDKATGPIKKIGREIEKSMKGVEKSVNKVGKSFSSFLNKHKKGFDNLGKAAWGVGAAFGAIGVKAINLASDFEQMGVAFETMLGSSEKAKEMMDWITEFAAKTPFELKNLTEYSQRLLAYGESLEEVKVDMKTLGDIAAGVGKDKLPRLINAFGQVRAKGRLMGEELRQFTEAGIPLLEELSKMFGKTTREVQDMISRGKIGFEDVREALKRLTEEGGRFHNLMEKQSYTLGGMWSNLQDNITITLATIGESFKDEIKEIIKATNDLFEKIRTWVKENKPLLKQIIKVGGAITGVVASIWSLNKAIQFVMPIIALLGSSVGLVVGALVGLYLLLRKPLGLDKLFGKGLEAVREFASYVASLPWKERFGRIKKALEPTIRYVMEQLSILWENIGPPIRMAINRIIKLVKWFYGIIKRDINSENSLILAALRGFWEGFSFIFKRGFEAIIRILSILGNILSGDWGKLWDNLKELWLVFKEVMLTSIRGWALILQQIFEGLKIILLEIMQKIKDGIVNIWLGIKEAVFGVVNGMIDGIKKRFIAIYDRVKRKVDAIKRLGSNIAGGVKNVGQSIASGVGNVWGGIKNFAGFRALGGPVESGKAYVVGEKGPELFVPKTSGNIVPSGGVNININLGEVNVKEEGDAERLVELIRDTLADEFKKYRLGF